MNQENNTIEILPKNLIATPIAWNAVFGLAIAVAGLITSEFLPVSLLTPMAQELGISEGMAGQAISVTAAVAMISSLLITAVTKKLNRRWVILIFCILQVASNLLVFFAPNFAILLAGRVLLGIGLGGFWAMLAATTMRLVPEDKVSKALSLIFASVSLATVVAAPLGSYLGNLFGWRNVFLIAAILGTIAFVWQALTLPSMPVAAAAKLNTLLVLLKRPVVKLGMLGTFFSFIAYASLFTYLRPFLEKVTGVDSNLLSVILLGFGVANLAGASIARYLLSWNLYRTLALMPLFMGLSAALLVVFGNFTITASILVAIWGMALGVVQLGWTAWLTRIVPDEVESAGGLQIAVIQFAIMTGAASGGLVFDYTQAKGVFVFSSLVAILAALAVMVASKNNKKESN